MVYFKKDNLIIEIKTHDPVETWLEINNELLELFQCINEDLTMGTSHQAIFDLLQALIPNLETAQRMKDNRV